jgi:parallel beta-helix repeat protein
MALASVVGGQAQAHLEGNTCENNQKPAALLYSDSAGGTARQNVCRQNGLHGIGVHGQAQPQLEGNTCENNQQCGIVYLESAGGVARQNVCRQNGYHGIGVQDQAQPQLEGNTCENNQQCGILYFRVCRGRGAAECLPAEWLSWHRGSGAGPAAPGSQRLLK